MSKKDKNNIIEEDILEEMENEIENMQDEELESNPERNNLESDKTKEILAKTLADFDNFKKRVERDRIEQIFYLKSDILKNILPIADDLERIIKNTPDDLRENALFTGVESTLKRINSEFEKLGVKAFESIGKEVNPDLHDVMTVVSGKESGIIFDEFEKGYMLGDKVLRHAKVIVGA